MLGFFIIHSTNSIIIFKFRCVNDWFCKTNVLFSDWRAVKVVAYKRRAAPVNLGRRSGQFTVVDKYPKSKNGQEAGSILLKEGIIFIYE